MIIKNSEPERSEENIMTAGDPLFYFVLLHLWPRPIDFNDFLLLHALFLCFIAPSGSHSLQRSSC